MRTAARLAAAGLAGLSIATAATASSAKSSKRISSCTSTTTCARGMSPDEARRQALIKLGGVEQTKERYRDRRGLPLVETALKDLRFALRLMRRSPGFTPWSWPRSPSASAPTR